MDGKRPSFISQDAYVDAMVDAMRARPRATSDATREGVHVALAEHAAGELAIHDGARRCAAIGVAMPVLWLSERLELSTSEERVLWTLLVHELDPVSRLLIRSLNTEQASDPAFDTLLRIAYGHQDRTRASKELAAHGSLRRLGLVVRTDGDQARPEHHQTFAASRRVLSLALGDDELDPALAEIVSISGPPGPSADLVVDEVASSQIAEALSAPPGLVIVAGQLGTGRRSVVSALAYEHGFDPLHVDCRKVASAHDLARQQLRTIARECRLLRKVPLLCHLDALGPLGDIPDRMGLVETELAGFVLATASGGLARSWLRPPAVIGLPRATGEQLAQLWRRAIPEEASDGDCAHLAVLFPLAPALILAAGKAAYRQAGRNPLTSAHIRAGVRLVLDDRLAGLATRMEITQRWDDLVLPQDQSTALCDLLARIRQRTVVYETWGFANKIGKGLGVSALLSGAPGTGKTMAAGLIANDLGIPIYQVDLSKIVSKWIGETERNLAKLFDAAEACHAILLFDEADTLFGKRTDVKSSNDRYANQETNYLLQRLESFTGICLLTTNHDAAIDEAFRRRLSVHIRFPVPEAEERKRLWAAVLPPGAPAAANLRFDDLAETFVMSGGYIRNAVLRAAFLAADNGRIIDHDLLTISAQLEYEAMGKIAPSLSGPR